MIKLDELHRGNSCLNKAADDEPLFVLRANDPLAPDLVRKWAERYFDSKKDRAFRLTDGQRAKTKEALELAVDMENWKKTHP